MIMPLGELVFWLCGGLVLAVAALVLWRGRR